MKNLLIKRPIVSLIASHFNISLIFFCLAAEDLQSEGEIGGDWFEYRILCDFHIVVGVPVDREDSLVLCFFPTIFSCCSHSHSDAFEA